MAASSRLRAFLSAPCTRDVRARGPKARSSRRLLLLLGGFADHGMVGETKNGAVSWWLFASRLVSCARCQRRGSFSECTFLQREGPGGGVHN